MADYACTRCGKVRSHEELSYAWKRDGERPGEDWAEDPEGGWEQMICLDGCE